MFNIKGLLRIFAMMDKESWDRTRQAGAFLTIPFVLAVPPILGGLIGRWLDSVFGTSPYLMYGFLLLGVVGGARECYRIIRRFGSSE
jgi:ATP synthase protein I